MSIRSKAKRDARKKKTTTASRSSPARPLVEHAHLTDGDGNIFGGAGLRQDDWVMVLGGKEVAATDSAAMMLAMLKHVAALQEDSGGSVRLSYSTQLAEAATAEAAVEGKSLDEYLAQLEAEREERGGETGDDPSAAGVGRLH